MIAKGLEFKKELSTYRLEDIIDKFLDFRGRTPLKLGMEWGNGPLRALSANNVKMGKIDFTEENYLGSEALYKAWMTKGDCKKGDILITTEAPLGNIAQIPDNKKYILSQRIILLKADESKVAPNYLLQLFQADSFQKQLGINSTGTTVLGIQQARLAKIEIVLPGLSQQRKIAKILTTVDNLIEKTEALIAKYEAIKQGMMHDLFTRGVDENGRLRPSYQEAQELYNKTEFGWVPKDWQIKEMSFFLDYISYGFTNPMPEMSEGPWMVTAANIFQGVIQYNTCRHTSKEAFDRLLTKKSRPLPGDILLTKDGTLGRIALVGKDGICINQSVAILRVNEKTTPMFIKLLLESPLYQQRLLHDAGGSTIKHIYITVVDKMPVAIPKSRIEQEKIISHIETIDKKVETERKYHNKMMSIKTALMQDLLTGKVRVPPDEETEAHV